MKSSEEYLSSIYEKQEICKLKLKQKKSRRRIMIASIAGIMCLVLAFVFIVEPMLSGKDKYVLYAADLMEDYNSNKSVKRHGKKADEAFVKAYADFAMQLFSNTVDSSDNVLVSPLSVYIALAMTANGADRETLSQMEDVFGLDMESLNAYMLAYADSLSSLDTGKLNIANSIWFRNDGSLKVNDVFLQTNADYYKADAFAAAFDKTTVEDINSWVKVKTDGMFESIINSLSPDDVMCLINTVLFDAEWKEPYDLYGISKKVFQNSDGKFKPIDFMSSEEGIYLECDDAVGVIKPYKNEQYSFVALLPNADVNIYDFAKTLNGEKWLNLIKNRSYIKVDTVIPKFEHDYSADMKDILRVMGMRDAFEGNLADFTGIGYSEKGPLYIGNVIHKTFISVDELGTKAGAVTAVIFEAGGIIMPEERKEVILNRPFVYAIMDNNTNLPIFIGTALDIDDKSSAENDTAYRTSSFCEGDFRYIVTENGEAEILGVTDEDIEWFDIPEQIGKTVYGAHKVVSINSHAFQWCEKLEEVTIPDTVTSIGAYAFGSCGKLCNLYIPASVTSIGDYAFANCDNLTIITPKGSYAEEYANQKGIPVINN